MLLRNWSTTTKRRQSGEGAGSSSKNLPIVATPIKQKEPPPPPIESPPLPVEVVVPLPILKIPQLRELYQELIKPETDDGDKKLKQILKSPPFKGNFPRNIRLKLWQRLLSVKEDTVLDEILAQKIRECDRDLPNQRVIRVDVERTRVDLSEFRENKTQEFLTQLLTYFCKSRKARYKQGLNEILAPFVYLLKNEEDELDEFDITGHEAVVYKMWTAFIDRFLPHLYDDEKIDETDEMIALQCSFRFFELLLLYHDPQLWHFLDHNKLKPELYASPWLMTMFAQNVPMSQAYELWETMLLSDHPSGDSFVVQFVALAFLCSNRNSFLIADPSDLPVLLTSKLSYHRRSNTPNNQNGFFSSSSECNLVLLAETLKHAINIGNELRKHTPDLLLWDLRRVIHVKEKPPSSIILKRLSNRLCATCSPEFFWMGITGKLEDSTEIIVVDCRPRREFEQKRARARLVFNFGVDILENPDKLNTSLSDLKRHVIDDGSSFDSPRASNIPPSLARAWRWHICVVGLSCKSLLDFDPLNDSAADVDNITGMCILHLLKHSLPCVSVVEGGWEKVIAACPDPDRLCFPIVNNSLSESPTTNEEVVVVPSATTSHPAYRRPRASYGDFVEDFDGPSFIVSRSSRGAPVKF